MRLPSKAYVDRTLKKAYEQHDTMMEILPFIYEPPNIYGERIGKSYGEPIAVPIYLEMDPTDLRLQDLGWRKEETDIITRVPFRILLDCGLANEDGTYNFSTDDRLRLPHLDRTYQLANHKGREPFRGFHPTWVYIGGRRYTNA